MTSQDNAGSGPEVPLPALEHCAYCQRQAALILQDDICSRQQ
ncbi:hypothetical protein [Actinoplanes sp. NPDC049681]